jgi:D-tyrosyl-tRNA(Tyr) deacylase
MRLIVQRVLEASVEVEGTIVGAIQQGLMILVGFENEDTEKDLEWMTTKMIQQRIFSDADGKMNLSLLDVQGDILLISQFTLYASYKKGNRPGFTNAAKPDLANELYIRFGKMIEQRIQKPIQYGIFGADMKVRLCNDGPVTIFMDSKQPE